MSTRLQVDADIPGGNIIVDGVEGDCVRLHEDVRDTEGRWFFWRFCVRNAAGRTLRFEFTSWDVIGTRGPCVSLDQGRTWAYAGTTHVQENRAFTYTFPADAHAVQFCFTIPYMQTDLDAWLARHMGHARLAPETLCTSRQGRRVEKLRLGHLAGTPTHRLLITARHHACESIANFVIEGIMDAVLADSELGQWYSDHVELLVVPFIDKDGVENGDQGKQRKPRDHGRDYAGESLYPETGTLRELLPVWSEDRCRVTMDVHCPWIRHPGNEAIYQVGSASEAFRAGQVRLGEILTQMQQGELHYDPAEDILFGQAWNIAKNESEGRSLNRWSAAEMPCVWLGTSWEIPYANHYDLVMSADRARGFGADVAQALRVYLESEAEKRL